MGRTRSCGFLHIFTYTDDGLFKIWLVYVRAKECPKGLESHTVQWLEIGERLL